MRRVQPDHFDPSSRVVQAARAISTGYKRNRESFENINCRFRLTRGSASSAQVALTGNLEDRIEKKGVWVVGAGREFFRLICDTGSRNKSLETLSNPKGSVVTKGGNGADYVSIQCQDEYYSAVPNFEIAYQPFILSANLYRRQQMRKSSRATPFTYSESLSTSGEDGGSPSDVLDHGATKNESFYILSIESDKWAGRDVLKCIMASEQTNKPVAEYWFDPRKGFLVLHMKMFFGENYELTSEMHTTRITECSNGRWFPSRTVNIGHNADRVAVIETDVESLKVDEIPNDSAFESIPILPGTQVNVPNEPYWTKLKTRQKITHSDLAKLYDKCKRTGEASGRQIDSINRFNELRDRSDRGFYIHAAWIAVLSVICGVSLAWFTRRLYNTPKS